MLLSVKLLFFLLLSTTFLFFYLGWTFTSFISNDLSFSKTQGKGEVLKPSTNTTITYTPSDGQIRSEDTPAIEVPSIGPNPSEQVRRLLWWSSIYGVFPGFFAIGKDDDLITLASKCKVK
ncbi:unnamed protein product, partial [Allacma fusca]